MSTSPPVVEHFFETQRGSMNDCSFDIDHAIVASRLENVTVETRLYARRRYTLW